MNWGYEKHAAAPLHPSGLGSPAASQCHGGAQRLSRGSVTMAMGAYGGSSGSRAVPKRQAPLEPSPAAVFAGAAAQNPRPASLIVSATAATGGPGLPPPALHRAVPEGGGSAAGSHVASPAHPVPARLATGDARPATAEAVTRPAGPAPPVAAAQVEAGRVPNGVPAAAPAQACSAGPLPPTPAASPVPSAQAAPAPAGVEAPEPVQVQPQGERCAEPHEQRASCPGGDRLASNGLTKVALESVQEPESSRHPLLPGYVASMAGSVDSGLYGVAAGVEAESRRSEPNSPTPSAASRSAVGPLSTLEDELSWTVRQMETHRRQIEVHQRQLSSLERRHAELVSLLTRNLGTSGGRGSPQSSIADTRSALEDFETPGLPAAAPAEGAASTGLSGFAAVVAAAEARLRNRSRPTSAGTSVSGSQAAAVVLQQPTAVRTATPMIPPASGQGSPSSVASEALQVRAVANLDRQRYAEQVSQLLEVAAARWPLSPPFVQVDAPAAEGDGLPFLFGALEVRLLLSEDCHRLLVRVGNGRPLELADFLARAEAIESRRLGRGAAIRPNTIAEEEAAPPLGPVSLELLSSVSSTRPPMSHLSARSPLGKDPSFASPSPGSAQWKSLFKSHWSSK